MTSNMINEATWKTSSSKEETQTTLGWHQTIERNNTHSESQTGQANKYHTKP